MESEITQISYSEHKPFNSTQNNSGLLRFRSAPSSFLANWDGKIEKNDDEAFCFNSSKATINGTNALIPPQYPRVSSSTRSGSMNGSYRAQSLDLMRQISTPAELFSSFPAQNGFGSIKNAGSYGFSNGQVEFSSPMSSTLGILSRISEVETENIEMNITHDRKFGDGYREPSIYGSALPFSSWNHSTKFGDNLNGLKTEMDCNDDTLISKIQIHGGGPTNRPNIPKTSTSGAEVDTMDKFLHLQDAVPCKLRAKRGCATHPRSIAERLRRTRISERMRKLQELVPNMEKQTNTSDMLDLAVDYIKELQKQYKSLSDIRSKCKCSVMQKHVSDQKY